jgi:hypothetical protein
MPIPPLHPRPGFEVSISSNLMQVSGRSPGHVFETRRRVLSACLAAVSVLTQDPIIVEPTPYELDFENAPLQVIHINCGPHEKSKCTSIRRITGSMAERLKNECGLWTWIRPGDFPGFRSAGWNCTCTTYGTFNILPDN